MIVEFAGAPGTGKSALASRLVHELGRAGVAAVDASMIAGGGRARGRRLAAKARWTAAGAVQAPRLAIQLLAAGRSGGLGTRELVARAVNLLGLVVRARRAARAPAIHVLDQGIIQELVSVSMTGSPDAHVGALVAAAPEAGPAVLVTVTAPPVALVERLERREGRQSRLEAVPIGARAEAVARVAGLVDDVAAAWDSAVPAGARPIRVSVRNEGEGPDDVDLAPLVSLLVSRG